MAEPVVRMIYLFMYVKKDQNRVNMASIVEIVYIIKYYIVMMLHGICDTYC